MFSISKSDIQRFAVSAIGALTVSSASIFAAAAPVKAAAPAAPATVAQWQAVVGDRVSRLREEDRSYQPSQLRKAEVALHFTADGDFAGASLAGSSGSKPIDARALRIASNINYPMLPAGVRGAPQTVKLNLYFGDYGTADQYDEVRARAARVEVVDAGKRTPTQIAAR